MTSEMDNFKKTVSLRPNRAGGHMNSQISQMLQHKQVLGKLYSDKIPAYKRQVTWTPSHCISSCWMTRFILSHRSQTRLSIQEHKVYRGRMQVQDNLLSSCWGNQQKTNFSMIILLCRCWSQLRIPQLVCRKQTCVLATVWIICRFPWDPVDQQFN